MGQPTITVFVDNAGTPHTFVKLDDGNGKVNYYGFAPSTPGDPHGPGKIGEGLTTHARGDRDNSYAGYIDDVGWSKTIAIKNEQYEAMMHAVPEWRTANHTYNGLGTLGGENCTTFVQHILQAGSVTDLTTSRTSLPINLIPADERRALFTTDADGHRSPSDALKDPLHTPGTPAYEYKQSNPELFQTLPNSTPTKDLTHSELRLNSDGSFTETVRREGDDARDIQTNEYNADGLVTRSTQVDGAGNDADYVSRTTTYDAQRRIDSVDVRRDDGTRDWTDYDQNSTHAWSRVESHFDAQGRLDYTNEFIDDGSRNGYDYDQTNVRGDRIWQAHIDPQGRTDWTYVTQDDGSTDWTDYDQTNVRGDRMSQTHVDAQGRTDWTYVTQDDGSVDIADYDQTNVRGDRLSQTHVDAQGRTDWAYVTQDDGSHDWTDYDQTNVRGDSIWQNRTDAQGREDWRYVTGDDGSHEWTDFDQNNERGDSIWQNRTDAWGREDWASITQDDGSRNWYDYDQDGSQGWSLVQSRFDASGREDYATVSADDGSRNWYDYDQDATQGWSIVQSHFDSLGREDFANMYLDGGSRVWYDYDQDGSRSWSTISIQYDSTGLRDHRTDWFDNGGRDEYQYFPEVHPNAFTLNHVYADGHGAGGTVTFDGYNYALEVGGGNNPEWPDSTSPTDYDYAVTEYNF